MGQADLTRQRLVRAALELFTTRGYHGTTTPLLAKKAGVAEGTIYRHFDSKEHLLNELYRGAARWATKLVQDAAQGPGSARERLRAAARALVDGAARDPGVVRVLFLSDHGALLDERSRDAARDLAGAVESLVAQGKAQGAVRTGSVELWAGVWLAVLRHVLDKISAGEWKPDQLTVEAAIDAAWGAIKTTE
jgi:AcrR family transcriptional regulator